VGNTFAGAMSSEITAYKKELDAEWKAKTSKASQGAMDASEALQRFLDTPMSDEERNRYATAAMDMALNNGADIKELTEIKKSWGIGQTEDVSIKTVDWSTAFPNIETALLEAREALKRLTA